MRLHPIAWLVWVAAAAVVSMVVRNPLYTLILLAVILLVTNVHRHPDGEIALPLMRIAPLILLFSMLYNGLFVHFGGTILVQLPAWPLIGGPITIEALADGFRNGLVLVTLLAIFTALNAVVRVSDLVRLVPAGLQDLGVVVLISLNYVPETRRHLQRIREAQAIRGHELRGLRDWKPVLIPLLIGGLERAMRVAEVMVARGFGATASLETQWQERVGIVLALTVTLVGWMLLLWSGSLGWYVLGIGLVLLLFLLWRRGRTARRTRYLQRPWRWQESLMFMTSLGILAIVLGPLGMVTGNSLSYSPYPRLTVPTFDILIGLAVAAFALPAFLSPGAKGSNRANPEQVAT